jgi:hypothetical protein
MNNENGELTKKAEMLEMNFLREMGVDTFGKYPDVEKHIDKITDILIGENDDLSIADEYDAESIEEMEQEIEDKVDAIESASANLSDLKRLVQSMKKSDMKTNLMDCIERMEMDLC